MSYLNWHVGMKVVCVKQDAWRNEKTRPFVTRPVFGGIYTIREFDMDVDDGIPGLLFVEIQNALDWYGNRLLEPSFCASRFRPVQTSKTDISAFTRILRNPHVRIKDDA